MEPGEAGLERIIEITDEFIAHGNPDEVAFWLGYRHGIKHHLRGIVHGLPAEERRRFTEIVDQGHRDKFIDAYARGYLTGIDGTRSDEILHERDGAGIAEISKVRQINGCSVCKHEAHGQAEGRLPANPGNGFWCNYFNKVVDWKEGAVCPQWVCEG